MGERIGISSSDPQLFMNVSWYVLDGKIFSYGVIQIIISKVREMVYWLCAIVK
jgi:hypothetical protein